MDERKLGGIEAIGDPRNRTDRAVVGVAKAQPRGADA